MLSMPITCWGSSNPIPNDESFDVTKLKAFADDKSC